MNIKNNQSNQVLRLKELAQYLSVSISTICNWNKQGLLPKPSKPTKRCTFWKKEQIDKWLEAKQAQGT